MTASCPLILTGIDLSHWRYTVSPCSSQVTSGPLAITTPGSDAVALTSDDNIIPPSVFVSFGAAAY